MAEEALFQGFPADEPNESSQHGSTSSGDSHVSDNTIAGIGSHFEDAVSGLELEFEGATEGTEFNFEDAVVVSWYEPLPLDGQQEQVSDASGEHLR